MGRGKREGERREERGERRKERGGSWKVECENILIPKAVILLIICA
jgi:hypothetical protein